MLYFDYFTLFFIKSSGKLKVSELNYHWYKSKKQFPLNLTIYNSDLR